MNCKEFEHLIPNFLSREMDYRTMEAFREHMDTCAACKEELSIQFLVMEGMKHLEDDGGFDLQKELEHRLAENNRNLHRHRVLMQSWRYIVTMLMILTGIIFIYYLG